ncbi:MAG: ATP-binding protein [Pseudomonadota bacterium]
MFLARLFVLVGMLLLSSVCVADDDVDVENLSARELLALLPTGQEFPAPRQVELSRIAVNKVNAEGLDELKSTACLSLSMALYGNAQQDEALDAINDCLPESAGSEPNVYLRLRSLRAGLWLLNGEPERSLNAYEALMAEDHSDVGDIALLRLRSNYAGALMENGQILGAIEEMQSVIQEGMALEHDFTVLGNANNLIVLLIEQRMYNDAAAWLERIAPVIDRSASTSQYFVASLRIHQMQLLTYLGSPRESARQLRDYINTTQSISVLADGSAYEFLGEALREMGDYDAAREAGEMAVQLLSPAPLESADARLSLIRTLIAQGNFPDAQRELRIVANEPLLSPIRQEQMLGLEMEVELARSGQQDLLAKYRSLQERRETRERTVVEQNSRYFDVKAEAVEQAKEIQRIDASREVLALRTAASESAASESAAVAEAARKQQMFTLAIVVLVAGIVVLFGFGMAQRRFDRQLRERQRELTNQLTVQVEEKTNALKAQLEEQAELERVVADKAQTEALGQLTGNVAHDFNNLLQVMSIANENLANLDKTNFQASLLEGSNRALEHAKSIIRQLLSYARRQTLAEETFSISDYLDNTITLLSAAIDARVTFTVDDQSDGAVLSVDRSQLTTAILNLLSNACDAMPDGGNLSLRVTRGESSEIDECIALTVEDDGMGMSEAQLERVFEPFFTTKAEDYGTVFRLQFCLLAL